MARQSSHSVAREELLQSLKKKELAPVYLFYGDEEYFIDEAVELLIASSMDETMRAFNLDIMYGGEATSPDIVSRAASYPMMGNRRVVVVREFEKLANKDPLASYAGHPSPSSSLALIASRPDFRQKVYKTLGENAVAVEFKALYESDVAGWILRECERQKTVITPDAAELIHSYVGRSLRELRNELEKLFLYVDKRKEIGVDDVNAVVGLSKQFNIYELQASIGERDLARALEIAEHMLQAGESAIGLITALTRYFSRLWIIVDCLSRRMSKEEIASALKMAPKQIYFLDKDIAVARRFSTAEIESGFSALTEADERLKTSNGSVSVIITLLLHSLFRQTKPAGFIAEYA